MLFLSTLTAFSDHDMRNSRKSKALSPKARERVMQALALKAAEGNATAAKIYFDESRAQAQGASVTGAVNFAALDAAFEKWAKGGKV